MRLHPAQARSCAALRLSERTRLRTTAGLLAGISTLACDAALAACNNNAPASGQTVTCDTSAPNPDTTGVQALAGSSNVTVNVLSGAAISSVQICDEMREAAEQTLLSRRRAPPCGKKWKDGGNLAAGTRASRHIRPQGAESTSIPGRTHPRNAYINANRMTEPAKAAPAPEHRPAADGIGARARAAFAPQYLNGLNPEQREAVETLDGPVLVLAGAGTGKTRVLTSRIAHILSTGRARPHEILSVTFTNKAAREMKLRVGQMVGQAVEGMPWLGTFHSIGGRILRFHAELAGLKSNFTVLDVDDQIRLLKQLLTAENIDEKRWPARVLAGMIDGWKNRGLGPTQVPAGEAQAFAGGKGGKLYTLYQERLKTLNAADFGDLLLENIRIFREHPDVLRGFQQRFRFILVDEYQDTNVAQYLWLRLLSQAPSATNVTALFGAGARRIALARARR